MKKSFLRLIFYLMVLKFLIAVMPNFKDIDIAFSIVSIVGIVFVFDIVIEITKIVYNDILNSSEEVKNRVQ